MSDGPIYLSAAFGDKIGYGHLARLAVLGSELMRRGESVVWWLPEDSFSLEKSVILRRRLDVPVWLGLGIESGYLVSDGTPWREEERLFRRRFYLTGDETAEPEERRAVASAFYVQTPRRVASYHGAMGGSSVLGGPRYIVVNPLIVDGTPSALLGKRSAPRDRVLITFGASALGREMTERISWINAWPKVVIWPRSYGAPPMFGPDCVLLFDPGPDEMAYAYSRAKLVVGALGMTAWETLAAGVPGIFYGWSNEHIEGYARLRRGLAHRCLGLADAFSAETVADNAQALLSMLASDARSDVYRAIDDLRESLGFDGAGAQRVAASIIDRIGVRA